jgi:hypothetical protein
VEDNQRGAVFGRIARFFNGDTMSASRAEELIKEFDLFNGIYKREAVEEALTLREEITPHLLRILGEVATDPDRYAEEGHYANVYAASLLAHFQEPAALEPIIRAFCIPGDPREEIWGDMVTETLPALLLQTCNGRLDPIKTLILDRTVYEYVRGAAIKALAYAVVRRLAPREEVVEFLSSLFSGTEADEDSDFWGDVACTLCDLHPEEAMPVLRQAFDDELIWPGFVNLENIERDLAHGREAQLASLATEADYRIPTDIHQYLSWFACFNPKKADRQPSPPSSANIRKQQQKAKSANRTKNKAAKKARKKNRR